MDVILYFDHVDTSPPSYHPTLPYLPYVPNFPNRSPAIETFDIFAQIFYTLPMKETIRSRKNILKTSALGAGSVLFIAGCMNPSREQSQPPEQNTITQQDVKNFFKQYDETYIDFDGYFGAQCVDLVQFYNKEVVHAEPLTGNAADIWKTYPKDTYDKVVNTPDGVPESGDIIIWDKIPNNKKSFGHIAIFYEGDDHEFITFGQNRPSGSPAHFQYHENYNRVLGWLHPKNMEK